MILRINRSIVFLLFTALFMLQAQSAISSATAADEEDPDAGEAAVIFKLTSPATRNPLPADILDRMRKELMALMGVEPEESAKPAKKTGH